MNEWICEEVPAVTIDGKVISTMLRQDQKLVRCKDCEYSLFKEGVVPPGHIVCTKPFTERWQAVKPDDWFCADGECKEGR